MLDFLVTVARYSFMFWCSASVVTRLIWERVSISSKKYSANSKLPTWALISIPPLPLSKRAVIFSTPSHSYVNWSFKPEEIAALSIIVWPNLK